MVNQAVSDMGSREATFTALAEDFQFDKKVRQLFLDSPMATLEDFRYYFAEEKEVDAFCAAEDSLKDAELRIQISRVRRAWAAVRQNGLRKENRNSVCRQWQSWMTSLRREPSGKSRYIFGSDTNPNTQWK